MAGMGKELSREEAIMKIKEVILSTAEKFGIKVEKIILFGSRARGDYKKESDWDILVVTREKLGWMLRKEFLAEILRNLIKSKIKTDILIIDKDAFEEYKKWKGFVYHHAATEGIAV